MLTACVISPSQLRPGNVPYVGDNESRNKAKHYPTKTIASAGILL